MTLGSNKSIFSVFKKNEPKKRKPNEEMNGFMRDDNFQTLSLEEDIETDNHSYETPSKRLRIEVQTNMSSDLNGDKKGVMSFFRNVWNKFKHKDNQIKPDSHNLSVVTTSDIIETQMNRDSDVRLVIEETPKEDPPKRRYSRYSRFAEKLRYRELIQKHTNNWMTSQKPKTKTENPILINLTKNESTFSFNKSSEPLFTTETLDNNTKIDLISRIKSKETLKTNKLFNTSLILPSFVPKHSTPKVNLMPNVLALQKQTPIESTFLQKSSLPESSQKFNNLKDSKKDLFGPSFVSDLRNSLVKDETSLKQKIQNYELSYDLFKNKRIIDIESIGPKIKAPLNRTELNQCVLFFPIDDRIEEDKEEVENETLPSDFPDLTTDMNKEIDAALKPTPPNEVLSEGTSGEICRKDMETLKGLNWLNDEIINFYLSLMVERGKNDNYPTVYAFNTFFYKKLKDNGPQSLKRWTRRIDVFANDFIFIPIHLGMHWCLAVIDFVNKRIEYYDSMGGNNTECVQSLKAWLQAESLDKKKCEFPMTDWTLQMVKDIPQQMNGSDCGMFTCKYAEYISRKAKINFTQAHMPYFRRRMVYEILTKQLL